MRILLVEDNSAIVMGLEYLLSQEGYEVSTADNIMRAKGILRREECDLVLLDIALPDGNGFDFCRMIKQEGRIPVIFLTAKDEEADVVKGLDLGADDYVIKPFRNRELVARITAALRRRGKESNELHYKDLVLDMDTCTVRRDETSVVLTKLEYKILYSLMSHPGKLFTRNEILSDIWDISGNFVNDNTLSVTMRRLREKLGDSDGQLIKTVRGMGYRLNS